MNFKMILEYDGSRYNGWQRQGNTHNTIQGKLEEILSKYFEQDIEVHGSGRTDAGVHAMGQVINFKVDNINYTNPHLNMKLKIDYMKTIYNKLLTVIFLRIYV